MEAPLEPSRAIVVGIDGSRVAIDAAVWAVDEAVSRDIPLRLVAVVESADTGPAERALRSAVTAVESTNRPVKIEVDLAHGRPARVLRDLSRSADLLCLGTVGVGQATGRHVGSTASTVAGSAHCPVAIIGPPAPREPRWVLAEISETVTDCAVLEWAVAEALLRDLPLRVLAHIDEIIRARLERILARYRAHHPALDVQAVHAPIAGYLARHAGSIALLATDRRRNGSTAGLGCSVLTCPAPRPL